jgi:hypothetical protein
MIDQIGFLFLDTLENMELLKTKKVKLSNEF